MSKKPPGKGKPVKTGGQHDPKQCNHRLNGQYIHYIPEKATEGKKLVRVFDGDGSRDIIVPSRNPLTIPGILGKSEFERLKQQAHVVTLEDKLNMMQEADRQRNQLLMESNQRKEQLLQARRQQKMGSKLDMIDSEGAKKNLGLLQRAKDLITEQDDRLLDQQFQAEDKRLDMMMEQRRQKLIQVEEQKRAKDEKKKQRYVSEVKHQIKENEMNRLLEAERIEEESKMLNKALIEMQREETAKLKEKQETQQKMREEFKKANKDAQAYKKIMEEEQRIADLRVQEFMKRKLEREEAREKEIAMSKAAKELEISRMREAQQKGLDMQAAFDEMNALRSQEEKEKEWREKEKEKAEKTLAMTRDLREARLKQIDDIRKAEAMELFREEEDSLRVAKVQRELFEKEQEEQRKKRDKIARHRKELLKQINEKERERISWQQEKFEDGKAQRLEYQVKDREVEDYLKKKVEKLKDTSIPEQYICDIERQINVNKL